MEGSTWYMEYRKGGSSLLEGSEEGDINGNLLGSGQQWPNMQKDFLTKQNKKILKAVNPLPIH